jgi:hypothetical protein
MNCPVLSLAQGRTAQPFAVAAMRATGALATSAISVLGPERLYRLTVSISLLQRTSSSFVTRGTSSPVAISLHTS